MLRYSGLKSYAMFCKGHFAPGFRFVWRQVRQQGRPFASNGGKDFREQMSEKHFLPHKDEVKQLQVLYPNAKEVVGDLFAPFKKSEEMSCPTFETDRSSKMDLVKTKMKLNWPVKTDVTGTHIDEDKSVENAYLVTCSLLQHLGIIKLTDQGAHHYREDEVMDLLEYMAVKQTGSRQVCSNFKVVNLLRNHEEEVSWSSSLQVSWPLDFTITSEAQSMDLAFYKTCLRTAMKLKTVGCFDQKNEMRKGILLGLDKYDMMANSLIARNYTNPDYEMFVDSSNKGMGAYLLSKDEDKIFWICDHWEEIQQQFAATQTSYNEFYALVTACYTWKHKFVGKKLVCYSDCLYSVNLVNHGLLMFVNNPRGSHEPYKKLYLLLSEVCDQYNITIVGVHVPRKNNVAADLLSRLDVQNFKDIVPTAFETPKKLKKLWFSRYTPPQSKKDPKRGKDGSLDGKDDRK